MLSLSKPFIIALRQAQRESFIVLIQPQKLGEVNYSLAFL